MNNVCVIIPSLDPDERLGKVVSSLIEEGFRDIIIVDDGSKQENKKHFPASEFVTLLIHEKNKGKGAALKTAIKFVMESRPDCLGVVTCDGDGQHLAADAKNICSYMLETEDFVLGVRDFSLPDVPPKSRIGNKFSSIALFLCCGSMIKDTQTGLRAIPKKLFLPMSQVEGDRFEYETNVLLEARSMKAHISQVNIQTVYLDNNKGTHFHPVKDSLRIFGRIIRYLLSSLSSFLIDIGLFALLTRLLSVGIILSTVVSRLLSSAANFYINKKIVFKSGKSTIKALIKYYLLAVPVMLLSAFGVKGIAAVLNINESSLSVTAIKLLVDFILFLLNYRIQKKWIFRK